MHRPIICPRELDTESLSCIRLRDEQQLVGLQRADVSETRLPIRALIVARMWILGLHVLEFCRSSMKFIIAFLQGFYRVLECTDVTTSISAHRGIRRMPKKRQNGGQDLVIGTIAPDYTGKPEVRPCGGGASAEYKTDS